MYITSSMRAHEQDVDIYNFRSLHERSVLFAPLLAAAALVSGAICSTCSACLFWYNHLMPSQVTSGNW